jgi:hypothetical protein
MVRQLASKKVNCCNINVIPLPPRLRSQTAIKTIRATVLDYGQETLEHLDNKFVTPSFNLKYMCFLFWPTAVS